MKQNLMQQQLRLNSCSINSKQFLKDCQKLTYDFTSKAFYISRQLLQSNYTFSKKALASYLQGKQISLQQNNYQQPPNTLKGYMHAQQISVINQMIQTMLDAQVLIEQNIILKKKSTRRIFATSKYDWNAFPKIIVQIEMKMLERQSFKKDKTKSRFSIFLNQKTTLSVNIEKKDEERNIKRQIKRKLDCEWLRKQEELARLNEQTQEREIQLRKKGQQQLAQKQKQKLLFEDKMNNFWILEKFKVQDLICPITDISILQSPSMLKSIRQRNQRQNAVTLRHALHNQIDQLKEAQSQKKNPIKPFAAWNLLKETFENETPQVQCQNKRLFQDSEKLNNVFAQISQQSMPSNNYSGLCQERASSFIKEEQKKSLQQKSFSKNSSAKRQNPFISPDETITVIKKRLPKTSFCSNFDYCAISFESQKKKIFNLKEDENTETKTMVFYCQRSSKKVKKSVNLDKARQDLREENQTMTIAELKKKSWKMSTQDLKYVMQGLKGKRDQFIDELIKANIK